MTIGILGGMGPIEQEIFRRLCDLNIRQSSPETRRPVEICGVYLTHAEVSRLLTLAELGKEHWDDDHEVH